MKKILVSLAVMLMLTLSGSVAVHAELDHHKPKFNEVELTEQQITELKIMYEDLVNQRKGLVEKYLEFGILSEDDAEKMNEHLDGYIEKLEKNNFIPKWDGHKKAKKRD